MADITYPYAPVDGDRVDPDGLNQNLYQTTSGLSIYETTNGRVEFANFDAGFKVQPHHIRPGQTGTAESAGLLPSTDYFSDLFAQETTPASGYLPIAGCGLTWYQEYDVTLAMFFASVHLSVWRQFGATGGAFGTKAVAPAVRVAMFFDTPKVVTGSATGIIPHTVRELPQTITFDTASAGVVGQISTSEAMCARHFNLSHLKRPSGSGAQAQLTAGWHTIGLGVWVPQNIFGQTTNALDDMQLRLNGAGSADARPTTYYSAVHRVRMYVKNISRVCLL
jgi:hypothetical protein